MTPCRQWQQQLDGGSCSHDSSLCAVLGDLDELLEEGGGQGVLLAGSLGPMQLAVVLDVHSLARVWVVLIVVIIIV